MTQRMATHRNTLKPTATHCSTHVCCTFTSSCRRRIYDAIHGATLQHIATHCNALQHTLCFTFASTYRHKWSLRMSSPIISLYDSIKTMMSTHQHDSVKRTLLLSTRRRHICYISVHVQIICNDSVVRIAQCQCPFLWMNCLVMGWLRLVSSFKL